MNNLTGPRRTKKNEEKRKIPELVFTLREEKKSTAKKLRTKALLHQEESLSVSQRIHYFVTQLDTKSQNKVKYIKENT